MTARLMKIVGLKFRPSRDQDAAAQIEADDEVFLVREPHNPHDTNAIMVIYELDGEDFHIGYIEREIAAELAAWLDEEDQDGIAVMIESRLPAGFLAINPMHGNA